MRSSRRRGLLTPPVVGTWQAKPERALQQASTSRAERKRQDLQRQAQERGKPRPEDATPEDVTPEDATPEDATRQAPRPSRRAASRTSCSPTASTCASTAAARDVAQASADGERRESLARAWRDLGRRARSSQWEWEMALFPLSICARRPGAGTAPIFSASMRFSRRQPTR